MNEYTILHISWVREFVNFLHYRIKFIQEISPECSLEGLMLKLKLQYWPPDVKNWLIRKDPDAEKDRRQEEKGTTEDEIVGWHHWLNGQEFEQAL